MKIQNKSKYIHLCSVELTTYAHEAFAVVNC